MSKYPIHYSYISRKTNEGGPLENCYSIKEATSLLYDDLDLTAFNINNVMYISMI